MTQTEETGAIRCRPGYTMKMKLKNKLYRLIVREYYRQGIPWQKVGRDIGIPAERLEEMATQNKLLNWYILDRLLHFYHKQIEIRLVDLDKD